MACLYALAFTLADITFDGGFFQTVLVVLPFTYFLINHRF